MTRHLVTCLSAVVFGLTFAPPVDASPCSGPSACCGDLTDSKELGQRTVYLGVAIQGIRNLDEKNGAWDGDYYLYEKWLPSTGFTPQTEIVNEISRQESPAFDLVEMSGKYCQRSRRLRSTFRVDYDLRRFPFDHQNLLIVLSDAQFDENRLRYADGALISNADEGVHSQLSGWRIGESVRYEHDQRRFIGEEGSPQYDYATFSVPVARRMTFHVTKYFLPLLIIVIVGFCVFWIDPEEINTQASIGVTCLLAAIALQFSESNRLPEVAYLTLADRVYVACYVAIALTLVGSVHTNSLIRGGHRLRALRIAKKWRMLFPVALAVAITIGTAMSFWS